MENREYDESERLKEAVRAFDNTKRRVIPEMPIVVNYMAEIRAVTRVTLSSGDLVFRTARPSFYEQMERWETLHLDAFAIRDEFLLATTERKALDFLRETGDFLPSGDDISWEHFQLWREFAERVDEHSVLTDLHYRKLSGLPSDDLDPTGQLAEMLFMLTGFSDHSYFGLPPQITSYELEHLELPDEPIREISRQTEESYKRSLDAIGNGDRSMRRNQRQLEEWFREPPPSAYSLEWVPELRELDLEGKLKLGGAMIQFLPWKSKLFPIMFIHPRCALEAIASAIYAERVAHVKVKRCPGCNSRIEIQKHKGKLYCSDRCKAKVQKRRQRNGNGDGIA